MNDDEIIRRLEWATGRNGQKILDQIRAEGLDVIAVAAEDAHIPRLEPTYGMCTGCGSVEVRLNARTGTRDMSAMGESSKYPTGYGCEVCS